MKDPLKIHSIATNFDEAEKCFIKNCTIFTKLD